MATVSCGNAVLFHEHTSFVAHIKLALGLAGIADVLLKNCTIIYTRNKHKNGNEREVQILVTKQDDRARCGLLSLIFQSDWGSPASACLPSETDMTYL